MVMEEDIIKDLNNELENVIQEGQSLLEEARVQEKMEELKTETELLIRKYPLRSVLAGAAAGFILARIFKSR